MNRNGTIGYHSQHRTGVTCRAGGPATNATLGSPPGSGNAMIGRELCLLLCKAGFDSVRVFTRMVYADSSKPELVEGFTKKTFTAMIERVRESAIDAGIIDQGIKDLYRTTEQNDVFCYTFFKALAKKV